MEIDPDERSDDLYAVLNVSRDASSEEVTKAYRKLAFVFHPDKHPAPDLKDGAQEAFGKLQEAYEILSDERKRQIYDIYGKQVKFEYPPAWGGLHGHRTCVEDAHDLHGRAWAVVLTHGNVRCMPGPYCRI